MTEEQPNDTPVQPRMSKFIPVMHTSIEGAHREVLRVAKYWDSMLEFCAEKETKDGQPVSEQFKEIAASIDYIAIFIESVSDEMAAITSSCNSLHDRYVEALATIKELEAQSKIDKATINASLSSIHAANDNR